MTLKEFLDSNNLTMNDIEDIYYGKDRWCRCGCGGRYHTPDSTGFKKAVNFLNRNDMITESINVLHGTKWVNVPLIEKDNRAYTVYFKNN